MKKPASAGHLSCLSFATSKATGTVGISTLADTFIALRYPVKSGVKASYAKSPDVLPGSACAGYSLALVVLERIERIELSSSAWKAV